MARNQVKKKRQLQDQKVTPLIRPPLALTFPFAQIVFPSLNQVSLSADLSRQRCCCSFWSVLPFTKKITNGFSVSRRDFFLHQKYRHDPCGCTTLLRTMVEMEGWHLSSFLTQIFGPTSSVTQHGLHKEPIHILLDFRKSFQMSWLNLFIITIWPLSWHEFNLVYNSLIWLSSLNKWRKLSHW